MNDYVVTIGNDEGAYFMVSADRYVLTGTVIKIFYFYYHNKVVCSIDKFRVFKIQRFNDNELVVEYQYK